MKRYVRIGRQWYSLSPEGLQHLQRRADGHAGRLIQLIRQSGRPLKSHPRQARTHPTLSASPTPRKDTP